MTSLRLPSGRIAVIDVPRRFAADPEFVRGLRHEMARMELDTVAAEFPAFRDRWKAIRLVHYAAGRCSFRDAALQLMRWGMAA